MLGKVLKYEMRACAREILPFFGLALAASLVLRFLFWLAPKLWEPAEMLILSLGSSFGILLVVAVGLVGFIIPVVRFYRGMVSDEGILSFTLPVKTGAHITGRVVSGSIFAIASVLVALICGLIFIPGFWDMLVGSLSFDVDVNFFGESSSVALPAQLVPSILGMIAVLLVVTMVSSLVQMYVSIAIGQRLARNKVVGSIVGYLLVSTVTSIATLFLMMIPAFALFGPNNAEVMQWAMSLVNPFDMAASINTIMNAVWIFLGATCLISIVFMAIEWWLTWYMLDRKLNLT